MERDESCNAYGPIPADEDQYRPTAADKARWAATMALIRYDSDKRTDKADEGK